MDSRSAASVFKITEEIHKDIDEIYEAVVDEDPKAGSKIDLTVNKLKALKSNLTLTNES